MGKKTTIGVGIVGTGFGRTTHLPAFQACARAKVVAIASEHRENAERIARELDNKPVACDWRELVTLPEVDLVSIATPPDTHREIAVAAINAGKAVLCEKPMAMNAAEAHEMLKRAQEAGVLAVIDHELRFLPGRRKMREMVKTGAIGEIRHAKLVHRTDSRAKPNRVWDWRSSAERGGGVLSSIGSHVIDAFRYVLDTEISHVFCSLATHITERIENESGKMKPVTADDEAALLMRFAGNGPARFATANVSLGMLEQGVPEHTLEVFGSEAALLVHEHGDLWRAGISAGQWTPLEVESARLAPGMRDTGWSRGFVALSEAIVDALLDSRTSVAGAATFADGYRAQLVIDAARESHKIGSWVTLKD